LRHRLNCFVFLTMLAAAVCARADGPKMPMADHVPADAVVYVGWAGTDALGPAYANSDLAAFLDNSNIPQLVQGLVGQGWEQVTEKADNKETAAAVRRALTTAGKHPCAFYVDDLKNEKTEHSVSATAEVALVCDAGPDAEQLRADLQTFVQGQSLAKLNVWADGPIVTISTRKTPMPPPNAGAVLSVSPKFQTAVKPLGSSADAAVVIYVDGSAVMDWINDSAVQMPGANGYWPKMRETLGIANLKSYALVGGFDHGQWMTSSALIAPGPRTGLLAVIEPHPADPALMARVPANATSVSVYNFDVALLYDTLEAAAATVPELDDGFHKVSGVGTLFLGRNLRRQILGPLGTQWVVFTDSDTHRVVALNHPNDAVKVSDGLTSATFGIVNLINSQVPGAAQKPVVTVVQKKVDGVFLTTAASDKISPTLGVADGILYVGLSPDSVSATIAAPATSPANDVTQSKAFTDAVARLHMPAVASFDYTDLARTTPAAFAAFDKTFDQLQTLLPNVEKPKLPSVDAIRSHLSPAVSISWADENGTYTRSVAPFPGATYLIGDPQISLVAVGTVSLALVPVINQVRDHAMLEASIANERQLATAIVAYAKDHDGRQPPDLGSLVAGGYMGQAPGRVFVLPSTHTTDAPADRTALADWVNTQAQYDLLWPGKVVAADSPRMPVLVERGATTKDDARPVAFADGHVDVMGGDKLRKIVRAHTANE
jgi:hypothetical protein